MRPAQARLLAWTMWVMGLAALGLAVALASFNPPISTVQPAESTAEGALWLSTWVGFGLVGALVVGRRPDNRIGWVLSGITLAVGIAVLAPAYARYVLVTTADTGSVLGQAAAWVATWSFFPVAVFVVSLVVLFPTGIPSRFGGRAIRIFLAVTAVDLAAYALRPGPVEGDTPPVNPLGIPGLRPTLDAATEWLGICLAVVALGAVLDAILRFRRSSGAERLQFRWFLLAVAAFPPMFFSAEVLDSLVLGYEGFDPIVVVFALWGNGTAAAIWVAITRHGLYEIDRIISRTLSYTLVTAVLVAVYGGSVFLFGTVVPVEGDLPVAVSTLGVAALFNPVRKRAQALVNRRFDRTRVDGELTVERFSRRLRNQTDLVALRQELLQVVADSVAPATMSTWLRCDDRK